MKNLAIALCLTLLLAACSSGSSVSEIPPNTSGLYRGPFESSNERDKGVMILNIAEDEGGNIEGTIQFEFTTTDLTCLINSTIEGTIDGFAVRLGSPQGEGTLTMQLTASTNALTGTYVTTGAPCSNFSGSGAITLTRV
jgi:hypothetical protein